jgi:hypothetical protein
LFHSDRGSQRASGDPGKTLAARGFAPGIGRKENRRNSAVAGTFLASPGSLVRNSKRFVLGGL